jgi:ubiquinone/menaquinone biosynthesis C-methylase UbiE
MSNETAPSGKVVLDDKHFDSKARQWDDNPVFVERARKIADALRNSIPLSQNMSALDYGSGSGLLSFPLKDELGHITLADTSAGMLEVVREKIAALGADHMTAIQADLSATSLPDTRFDLIYSSMALHHIPDTDAILAAFYVHLNPGGWLGVADLDQEDGSFHGIEVEVHHGFDRKELAAKARRAGFGEVVFQTVFEIEKEQAEGRRAYPVFLMLARREQTPAS